MFTARGQTTRPSALARNAWLPVLVSVAGHGLFLLLLGLYAAPGGAAHGTPAPDTRVSDTGLSLTLLPPSPRIPQAVIPIQVVVPPLSTPAAAPPPGPVEPTPEPSASLPSPPPSPAATGARTSPPAPAAQSAPGTALGGGPGGHAQGGARFFRVAARCRSVVYVIDRSFSMGLGALDEAKGELLASLGQLAPGTRFQVICYSRVADTLSLGGSRGLVPADEVTKRQAADQVARLRPEGGTAHLPALRLALSLQPEVIFFVTDASDLTAEQIRQVTRMNLGQTAIHVIDVGASRQGGRDGPLGLLAVTNRGTYSTPRGLQ